MKVIRLFTIVSTIALHVKSICSLHIFFSWCVWSKQSTSVTIVIGEGQVEEARYIVGHVAPVGTS